MSASLAELKEALALSNGLLATKYLAAASLACVVYDSFLLLEKEFRFIWRRSSWDTTGLMYLLIRYCNLAGLLYAAYAFSGHRGPLDDHKCRTFLMTSGFTGLFSIGCANGFLTLRLFALWDHRKSAKVVLFAVFGVSYAAIVAFFAWTLSAIFHTTYYNPLVGACLLSQKPVAIVGVWAAMSVFDVFMIVLGVSNALHQPYTQNVEVIMRFRRDGAIFFLAVFVLRLINLVCSVVLEKEYLLVNLFFVWGMVTITTCRLILRVEEIRHNANRHVRYRTYELGVWRSHHTASLQT